VEGREIRKSYKAKSKRVGTKVRRVWTAGRESVQGLITSSENDPTKDQQKKGNSLSSGTRQGEVDSPRGQQGDYRVHFSGKGESYEKPIKRLSE